MVSYRSIVSLSKKIGIASDMLVGYFSGKQTYAPRLMKQVSYASVNRT